MNLSDYIKAKRGNGAALAAALHISPSYLSQLAEPGANVAPARCVEIERATGGQVTRRDLRPDDWQAIWPELDAANDTGERRRSTDLQAKAA